jgi:hypothetical protein
MATALSQSSPAPILWSKVLEMALMGGADCIVTGDPDLLEARSIRSIRDFPSMTQRRSSKWRRDPVQRRNMDLDRS